MHQCESVVALHYWAYNFGISEKLDVKPVSWLCGVFLHINCNPLRTVKFCCVSYVYVAQT